jgi:hypothetical protein
MFAPNYRNLLPNHFRIQVAFDRGVSVSVLAEQWDLSERQVWNVLKDRGILPTVDDGRM